MKSRLFFIFFASIVFASGCATKNTASNHDILSAINKQSEAITNLATAIRTPTPTREESSLVKKTGPSQGHSLTEDDLYHSRAGGKNGSGQDGERRD